MEFREEEEEEVISQKSKTNINKILKQEGVEVTKWEEKKQEGEEEKEKGNKRNENFCWEKKNSLKK